MSAPAPNHRWIRFRVRLASLVLASLFGVVGWKAHRLQIVEAAELRDMAEQQYLKKITLAAKRGTITDRNGAPLALSVDVDSVYANPRMIGGGASEIAQALAGPLGLDPEKLRKQLTGRRYFVWVKRRISPPEAKAVRALKLRGIFVQKESKRFYPNRGLGATVVGFAGLDSKGLEGIELSMNRWLRGSPVRVQGLRDARGRPVLAEGSSQAAQTSHDVILSIDRAIQFEVEQALAASQRETKARWTAAVVLDSRSGDILAMASTPAFDPNHPATAEPSVRRNRALTDAFEPGSTMKIFSVTAALQAGVAKDNEVLYCEKGRMRIGRHIIHDSKPHGYLSIGDILKKSSNICVSKLAMRLGKTALHHSLKRFGFGQRTEVPLRGERRGVLREPRRWSQVGLANIAFGHGMTATVLQLAQALTAIANDGMQMKPRLVLQIKDAGGKVTRDFPVQGKQVIAASLAHRMRFLLRGVTQKGGTAVAAALPRYTVAGKTGTAQKVDPKTGTYAEDKYVASFIGLAPASKPRLIVAVVIDEPSGDEYYGGDVAGPVFARIAGRALRFLGVRPDKAADSPAKGPKVPAPRSRPAEDMAAIELAPPLPTAGAKGHYLVPDFTGMSMAEALEAAQRAGLDPLLRGSGRAVGQSPGPGLAPGSRCTIAFRPPG